MAVIDLVFLWHMHQPYYSNPIAKTYPMPWVRLHGVKGYYDIPLLLEEFPQLKMVVNLTPSLVKQIKEYSEENIIDDFFRLSQKPAEELNDIERIFLLKNFFLLKKETMIQPYPEYLRLLYKRGTRPIVDFGKKAKEFSAQELRDLQVWFNLAWFGFKAQKRFPEITELRKKGKDFSEEEKNHILELQKIILKELIDIYSRLQKEKRLELSTSPFYHPILPLLCDTEIARRASPEIKLPSRFAYPQDAKEQIQKGFLYIEKNLGSRPIGMWPSEASVSEQVLEICAEEKITWLATCEQIIEKTKKARRAELIYQPWRFRDTNLFVVFRDRALSDLISFTYGEIEAELAVSDLLRRLEGIKAEIEALGKSRALVVIALDGENPWENYPESGRDFLRKTFERLCKTEWINLSDLSSAITNYQPERIDHIEPGSWMEGKFEIWIGEPEENLAWEYLLKVRKDFDSLSQNADESALDLAKNELFASEGSDWFWWYGDDFYSEIANDFDEIFRTHLRNVYLALNQTPPLFLEQPVRFDHPVRLAKKPLGLISPVIDGRETNYYEWQEAGCFEVLKVLGAHYIEEPFFSAIYFGFDLHHLYLRLDPHQPQEVEQDIEVIVKFEKPTEAIISFPFHLEKLSQQKFILRKFNREKEISLESDLIRKEKIIELAVSFSDLGFSAGEEVWFRIEIKSQNQIIARYPQGGVIIFQVPSPDFETKMWNV